MEWQRGPEFLKCPEAEWPVKMASKIVTTVAVDIKRRNRKAFSGAVTRVQSQKTSVPSKTDVNVDLGDSMDEDGHPMLQLPPKGQGQRGNPWV